MLDEELDEELRLTEEEEEELRVLLGLLYEEEEPLLREVLWGV